MVYKRGKPLIILNNYLKATIFTNDWLCGNQSDNWWTFSRLKIYTFNMQMDLSKIGRIQIVDFSYFRLVSWKHMNKIWNSFMLRNHKLVISKHFAQGAYIQVKSDQNSVNLLSLLLQTITKWCFLQKSLHIYIATKGVPNTYEVVKG